MKVFLFLAVVTLALVVACLFWVMVLTRRRRLNDQCQEISPEWRNAHVYDDGKDGDDSWS